MNNHFDQILIKNKQGQFKTVDLDMIERELDLSLKPTLEGISAQKIEIKKPAPFKVNLPLTPKIKIAVTKQAVDQLSKKEILPEPLTLETAMPAFYFHREDEEEAAKFKNKEKILEQRENEDIYNYLTEQIIAESELPAIGSLIMRLKRVIDSRLREVRDLIETKEVLVRPANLGGVGLDNTQAQKILKIIEKKRVEKEEIKEGWNNQPAPEPVPSAPRQNIYRPVGSEVPESEEIVIPRVRPELSAAGLPPIMPSMPPVPSMRARMSRLEYQPVYKPMGPIEELANYDLTDFRALAPGAGAAVAKIKYKIEMLTSASYEEKAKGIRGWRSSPIYKRYLTLGEESMEKNLSVEAIIAEKFRRHEPCLSLDEFKAIADLNEQMAY